MRKIPFLISALALAAASRAVLTDVTPSYGNVVTNTFLGASTFYSHGYTGSGVTIANVEGAVAYPNHEIFAGGKLTQTFVGAGANAVQDTHPTMCLGLAGGAGLNDYSRGIAYGAELWSGGFAQEVFPDGSGTVEFGSIFSAYHRAMLSGVNGTGRVADVVSRVGDSPSSVGRTAAPTTTSRWGAGSPARWSILWSPGRTPSSASRRATTAGSRPTRPRAAGPTRGSPTRPGTGSTPCRWGR